jgi:membrane-bound lytic murein transglycosylase D
LSPAQNEIGPESDSLLAARLAADSAADASILEQLAVVRPPDQAAVLQVGDSLAGIDPSTPTDALDLTTWADHDRVRYYLDFFQGPARPRMAVWLTRLPVYEPMVRTRFEAEGLPGDLVYLGLIESGYSNVAVSRSRAVGMWQFMRGTARWMGLRVDKYVDERRDPVKATDAAARYLKYLTDRFGSHYLAAAAYNGGPGTVSRGLERMGVPPSSGESGESAEDEPSDEAWSDDDFFTLADSRYLRTETKDYVPKLIAAARIAKDPVAYGFEPIPSVSLHPTDSIVVPDMTGLDVIARLAGTSLTAIRELNPHYLRLVTPPGRRAVVRLPTGTASRIVAAYASLPASKRVVYREHTVRKGETLGGIARRYAVGLAALREANPNAARRKTIQIGQVLRIPPAGGGSPSRVATAGRSGSSGARTHLVRRGETLSELSERYGVSVQALKNANGLISARQLKAGSRIRIPA